MNNVKASELLREIYTIQNKAKETIIALMTENNMNVIDFTLDKDGRSSNDDGYDEEWVLDYATSVDAETRHGGSEWANVVKVEKVNDQLEFTAEGSYDFIPNDGCYPTTTTFIDVLARLEAMLKK